MPQVRIELDEALYAVLEQYAEDECRSPTLQATWLVRHALRERLKVAALEHQIASQESVRLPSIGSQAQPPLPLSDEEQQIFGSHPVP